MGSHCTPHMRVDSSIHSESAAAKKQAASRRRTGRTPMSAGGDREQKPGEDGWNSGEMHDRARARPAITPLSLSPGQPVSCERIRRQAQVETLRRVTAPRLPVKPSDRDTVAQVQRVQIASRTHTHTHTCNAPSHMHSFSLSHSAFLSPFRSLIGISDVPPSTCPSLFQ